MVRHLALVLALALIPVSALGHSKAETTFPGNGAVLTEPPSEVWMDFDQPIAVTMARLIDGTGAEHDLVFEQSATPKDRFEATPTVLPQGQYTIDWRGISADGHVMQGKISFELK